MANKKNKVKKKIINYDKLILVALSIFFLTIFFRLAYLSLFPVINGINLQDFVSSRNTKVQTIEASRGTIYDVSGNVLSQNINAYTVIAYLDRSPNPVVDKEYTAEKLAPIIDMEVEDILVLLSRENVYQVELGPGGRGISELTKEAIVELELTGIDFVKTYKRYYPNNDFLSYTIGYAVSRDDSLTGEMGIEGYFDSELSGVDGTREYQQDLYGFKIANTPEIVIDPIDGKDIYLTINSDIQMFIEAAIKEQGELFNPEFLSINVMEAETGKILGTSSYPSFDPNLRNMTNYLNPLTSFSYEPGSTMKIYTYMAAMEKGTYIGDELFTSGSIDYYDGYNDDGEEQIITISDWNDVGWGDITYDEGFYWSSNMAIANLLDGKINKYDLLAYYEKLGFGSQTGIMLPRELSGNLDFWYEVEVVNAGFGQGITTTPIQNLQALTSIANDGVMLIPHIVEKIVDPSTGEVEYQAEVTKLDKVATSSTVNKIKDLMYSTVNLSRDETVGYMYSVDGFDVIGKTGTAQIFDNTTGEYMNGTNDVIYSFAGMYPYDDPKIIIYASMKIPEYGGSSGLSNAVTTIIEDIGNYYGLKDDGSSSISGLKFSLPSVINKEVDDVISYFTDRSINPIIIGDEGKILYQYPFSGEIVTANDRVLLFTNNINELVPSFYGVSYKEAMVMCNYLNYNCNFEGSGFVTYQSIDAGLEYEDSIDIILTSNFEDDVSKDDEDIESEEGS